MDFLLPRALRSLSSGRAALNNSRANNYTAAIRRDGASICIQCQWRALSMQRTRVSRRPPYGQRAGTHQGQTRGFWGTRVYSDAVTDGTTSSVKPTQTSTPPSHTAALRIAPDEDLPSHKEGQKWTLTKRVNQVMDRLLTRLSTAGHEINKYTGTDYSGIEALRREIKEQEELVKTHHEAVRAAKTQFDEAQTLQMASNKEVVALLERKNSWSSADLERYMSLIRSEHVNEQSVSVSREALLSAERSLEDARSRLERRERAQYHEEQIWSDTIRRNSTWVTFGLMGFNVILLLANIGVVEPWRRQRMVREIKASMDEKARPTQTPALVEPATTANLERVVDEAIVPEVSIDKAESAQMQEVLAVAASADDFVGGGVTSIALQERAGLDLNDSVQDAASASTEPNPPLGVATRGVDYLRAAIADIFSSRVIAIKKVELTTIVLQGAVAGGILTASCVALFLRTR